VEESESESEHSSTVRSRSPSPAGTVVEPPKGDGGEKQGPATGEHGGADKEGAGGGDKKVGTAHHEQTKPEHKSEHAAGHKKKRKRSAKPKSKHKRDSDRDEHSSQSESSESGKRGSMDRQERGSGATGGGGGGAILLTPPGIAGAGTGAGAGAGAEAGVGGTAAGSRTGGMSRYGGGTEKEEQIQGDTGLAAILTAINRHITGQGTTTSRDTAHPPNNTTGGGAVGEGRVGDAPLSARPGSDFFPLPTHHRAHRHHGEEDEEDSEDDPSQGPTPSLFPRMSAANRSFLRRFSVTSTQPPEFPPETAENPARGDETEGD
jgi:hypothetical protein